MAKSRFTGGPFVFPLWPKHAPLTGAPTLQAAPLMIAATDRMILTGTVLWADGASHDLHIIHWRSGNGASPSYTARVGPRDIDTVNGPPSRDDGAVDQSATHVNPAIATNFASTLDADRTLAHGAEICLVWDFSAFTSGTCGLVGLANLTSSYMGHRPQVVFYNGSTYVQTPQQIPSVTLEALDGTFGILSGGLPRISAAINTTAFNSGSAADEVAMAFTVAAPMWATAAGFWVTPAAGADFSLVLYEGTTAKATVAIDANTIAADAGIRWVEVSFPDVALTVGNTYYLAVKPTTANNVSIYSFDVSAAGHLAAFAGGFNYSTRVDAGAWAAVTTTRLPFAYIGISAVDDGAGGGGSGRGGSAYGLTR